MKKLFNTQSKNWVQSVSFVGLVSLVSIGFEFPVFAANLDLNTWEQSGDVKVESSDQATLSTDGLVADDQELGANNGDFNFSGEPASMVGFGGLEDFLNIEASLLDIEGSAYEGSAIKTNLTVNAGDRLIFDWQFFTNETSTLLAEELHPLNDYAFLLVNGEIEKLADYQHAINSSPMFDRQTEIETFDYLFAVGGTYSIALGVIDVDDFSITSALSVENVRLEPIPEPLTILGVGTAIALGTGFKKSIAKKTEK